METGPRFAEGLRALAEFYDLFLLDQFGVLHDGLEPYPGVAEALTALRAEGKKTAVITNSGRTAAENAARIGKLGLDTAMLDAVVTSGDAALAWMAAEAADLPCFPIGTGGAVEPLVEAGIRLVERIDDAALIYLGGLPGSADDIELQDFEPWLKAGLERGLPMVCANQDRRGPLGGRVVLSPGAVAALYSERGGDVRLFGKPDPSIFRHAMGLFPEISSKRCVMVGDMPETDLAGAAAAGIDAAWVLGGVYAAEVGDDPGSRLDRVRSILAREGASARWALSAMAW